jgi:hypothetical protein
MIQKMKEISGADLEELYVLAVKINKIGKKYGLFSYTKTFITAIDQIKNKPKGMEFGKKK